MKTLERTLTPAEEAVRQREREAVRYRVSGKTLEATAEAMGIRSPSGAQIVARLVRRWRGRNQVELEERRQLDLDRLDMLWGIVLEAAAAGSPKAVGLVKDLVFVSQIVYGRQAPAVQVNVSVDAEGLRAQRWEEIKDTPVGQLLADPSAFADPAAVEGEFHEPGNVGAGVAVGANDTGGAGVDAGDQRAVGPDQPVGEGGAGSDQGDGGKAVDGVKVRKPRYPHLHVGLAAASRGYKQGDNDE